MIYEIIGGHISYTLETSEFKAAVAAAWAIGDSHGLIDDKGK